MLCIWKAEEISLQFSSHVNSCEDEVLSFKSSSVGICDMKI